MIVFYGVLRQDKEGVVIKGVSAHTLSTRLYWKLWEHVA